MPWVQSLHFLTASSVMPIRSGWRICPPMPWGAMGINFARIDKPVLLQPTSSRSSFTAAPAEKQPWMFSGTAIHSPALIKNRTYTGLRTLDVAANLG